MIAVFAASVSRFITRHFALFMYAFLYLVIVVAILPPTGEALLTDDCDYSITVFEWIRNGKLQISDFPSMTLIGHLGWGAAFAKVFGSSPTVLRASTMVMVWLGGLAIYYLAIAHQRSTNLAAFCAATYVFNPFFLFYAYTFNTDVAGCSAMLLFLAFVQKFGNLKSNWQIACLGAMAGYCFLIRQTAAIPAIWYAVVLLIFAVKRHVLWSRLASYIVAFALPPVMYFLWLHFYYDWPIGYEKHFLVIWQLFHVKIMGIKIIRMALAIGLYTLPLAVSCIRFKSLQPLKLLVWLMLLIGFGSAFLFVGKLKPVRPYWSQEFYDCGFGKMPEVKGLDEWIQSPKLLLPIGEISLFDLVVMPLSLLSLFCWLYLVATRFKYTVPNWNGLKPGSDDSLRSLTLLTFASQLFLILAVWDVFDRYFMPAIAIAIVLLALWFLPQSIPLRFGNAVLFLTTVVGVLAIQDSCKQNEAAWKLARFLEGQGISPSKIWIGHQYFGTHAYLPSFYRILESVDGKLVKIDRFEREKLMARPNCPSYRVSLSSFLASDDIALARIKFSSWIRNYDLYAIKVADGVDSTPKP